HHLPSESYALSAQFCLAPYRLGLTATPERMDGQEERLYELIGPLAYRKDIHELSGSYLAEYDTVRIIVPLHPQDREQYEQARAIYRQFLLRHGIRMSDPNGWSQFIIHSTRSQEGQRAMAAYRKQRELALAAPGKFKKVEELLEKHAQDQVLLFTQ